MATYGSLFAAYGPSVTQIKTNLTLKKDKKKPTQTGSMFITLIIKIYNM
jgi:hypothetical protein